MRSGDGDWVKNGKQPPLCGVISLGLIAAVAGLVWMLAALV